MHDIQDRLKALAGGTLLAPPESARQATLDAMAEAATANAAATRGVPDTERWSEPSVARSGSRAVRRRSRLRSASAVARAAVWVVLLGAAIAVGTMAVRGSLPGREPDELAASVPPAAGLDVMDATNTTHAADTAVPTIASPEATASNEAMASPEVTASNEARESSEAMFELAVASAQLDLMLADLPRSRQVMRLGTAGTIIGLEDQIRLIDSEIERADAVAAPLEIRTALMRDRVDVQNALYYVRYAQSNAFAF